MRINCGFIKEDFPIEFFYFFHILIRVGPDPHPPKNGFLTMSRLSFIDDNREFVIPVEIKSLEL